MQECCTALRLAAALSGGESLSGLSVSGPEGASCFRGRVRLHIDFSAWQHVAQQQLAVILSCSAMCRHSSDVQIDPDCAALVGHSYGALTVGALTAEDPSFACGVAIDPWWCATGLAFTEQTSVCATVASMMSCAAVQQLLQSCEAW